MWLLTCPNKGGHSYRLTKEKDHFVSRTVGDIVLSGDQSVSRKHAVLKFTPDIENSNDSVVTITDLGSKYGTYINESMKLDPNKPYLLKNGDVIKFGCQWNEWRFDSKPLVVITSSVTPELKVSLKKVISELGGKLVSDWQETCSHLTMTSVLLTAKVVCSLASAVPIVTPEYWTCFQEALEQKKFPPDHNDFIPPLKENILNKNKVSFVVNEERRTIFSGKTFVFSTERHMKTYKPLISAAGGNSVTLMDCGLYDEDFFKPNIILMQHTANDESQHPQSMQHYSSIFKSLKSKGSRPIPESEIGLAILMCSLSIYCNPQYNVVKNVLQGGSMVNLSQLKAEEVWAADTPSVVGDITNIKMEETFEEKSVVENALSVPESSSSASLSQDSGGQTIRFCDEETPMEMGTLKSRSTSKPGPEDKLQDIPENVASRKRIASSYLIEPAAIKVSSESISSNEELTSAHTYEEFRFTDIPSSRKPRTFEVTSQNEADASLISVNESMKRKHDDNDASPPVKQSSKRNCREATTCVPKQNGSETVATISESNHFLIAPKEQILQHDKRSASKDVKNWSSLDHHLNKRAKIVEEEELATCDASMLRRKQSEDGEFASKENRTSSKVVGVQADDAIPSTSKGVEGNGISYMEKQSTRKTGKKAEERRGKHAGLCFDMVVKMEALVIETSTPPVITSDVPTHQVNFKKFKKVRPQTIHSTLPEIIGERDLVPYKES